MHEALLVLIWRPAAPEPVGQQQTESGRMNRLELHCVYRGLRGRTSLFCLMWVRHKKGYKYSQVGFAMKAQNGTE